MSEANALVIAAYFEATHTKGLPASTKALYVKHLSETDVADAQAAIDLIARWGEFPPTPQRIAEVAIGCRNARLEIERGSDPHQLTRGDGPSLAEYLDSHPDKRSALSQIRGIGAEKMAPMTPAEREELGQLRPPARQPVPLGLCDGVGKPGVYSEAFGEWCCSSCGGPASVGCWAEDTPAYNAYHRALEKRQEAST